MAAVGALSKLTADFILDAGQIQIPITAGRTGYAQINGVSPLQVGQSLMHVVDAQRDRTLAVFARLKRVNLDELSSWCAVRQTSGMPSNFPLFATARTTKFDTP